MSIGMLTAEKILWRFCSDYRHIMENECVRPASWQVMPDQVVTISFSQSNFIMNLVKKQV